MTSISPGQNCISKCVKDIQEMRVFVETCYRFRKYTMTPMATNQCSATRVDITFPKSIKIMN